MNGFVRYFSLTVAAACAMNLLGTVLVHAQSASFIRDCQKWIDQKGYSTDYIEQKLGKRQPGMASSWRGNILVENVQPGDVVLLGFRRPDGSESRHAAFVEEARWSADGAVSRLRLSEWNWGRMTDKRCLVTVTYGRLAPERWIELSAVAQVWRPSLPLRYDPSQGR